MKLPFVFFSSFSISFSVSIIICHHVLILQLVSNLNWMNHLIFCSIFHFFLFSISILDLKCLSMVMALRLYSTDFSFLIQTFCAWIYLTGQVYLFEWRYLNCLHNILVVSGLDLDFYLDFWELNIRSSWRLLALTVSILESSVGSPWVFGSLVLFSLWCTIDSYRYSRNWEDSFSFWQLLIGFHFSFHFPHLTRFPLIHFLVVSCFKLYPHLHLFHLLDSSVHRASCSLSWWNAWLMSDCLMNSEPISAPRPSCNSSYSSSRIVGFDP